MRFGYVAVAALVLTAGCKTSSESSVTTVEDRGPVTIVEKEAPAASKGPVVAVRSFRDHAGAGRLAVVLSGAGRKGLGSEPRTGGLRELEIEFNEPVNLEKPDRVRAVSGERSIAAKSASVQGSTLRIKFEGLEDGCYRIVLADAVEGSPADVKVRVLSGDADGDGRVDLSDAQYVKSRAGQAVSAETAAFDVDLSGGKIDQKDMLKAKAAVGHAAACE